MAIELLKCGWSELRRAVSENSILDFKDLVWKKIVTYLIKNVMLMTC